MFLMNSKTWVGGEVGGQVSGQVGGQVGGWAGGWVCVSRKWDEVHARWRR